LCRSRTSRMRLPAAFGHCAKLREHFFILALSPLNYTFQYQSAYTRYAASELNLTESDFFKCHFRPSPVSPVLYIMWDKSSDVPLSPTTQPSHQNSNHSLINTEKLCSFAQWPKATCSCGTTSLIFKHITVALLDSCLVLQLKLSYPDLRVSIVSVFDEWPQEAAEALQ
jgi:hypothetical protein